MSVTFYGVDRRRPHPRILGFHYVIDYQSDDPQFMNLSSVNTRALLALLGFAPMPPEGPILDRPVFNESHDTPDYLVGERSLLECKLAILRARKSFQRLAATLTFPDQQAVGAQGARLYVFGLDAEGLRSRLERFAEVVDALGTRGATHIVWS
jgi:hypothetical protein